VVFAKQLREGVRRGRIRCSVRIWQRAKVKVGGRYPMDDGHIVVDSIDRIARKEITDDRAVGEWVVRAPQGTRLALSARAERAGAVRAEVVLD